MIHYTGVDLGLFFALELKAGISMHHYTGVDVDLLAKDAASGCKAGTGEGMIHYTGVDLDLSLMPLPCYCQEGNRLGLRSFLIVQHRTQIQSNHESLEHCPPICCHPISFGLWCWIDIGQCWHSLHTNR